MSAATYMLAFICFAAVLSEATGLTCYNCTYPGCMDPFSSKGVGTCEGSSCLKSKAEAGGVAAVVRTCSPTYIANACREADIFGVKTRVCTCNTDRCNGQAGLHPSGLGGILVAAILAAYVIKRFQ